MIGLSLIAQPLISVVLTEKWLPAVPILQVLCFAGILYPVHAINLNILNVKGKSNIFLKLEIIKKISTTLAIFITYRWGVQALVWGQVATSTVALLLNTHYSGKYIAYNTLTQVVDLLKIAALSIPMIIVVSLITSNINNELMQLILSLVVGGGVYFATGLMAKTPELSELLSLIKRRQ